MPDTTHSRREFLRAAGVGLACSTVIHGQGTERPETRRRRRPNFIVMMADDLGAHELGCYGHPEHQTPNLDRLAQTGIQFRTCYATPICHPSRFLIMTGQYAHHNGVYHFASRPGGPKPDAPEEQIKNHVTFAHVLKQRGYATALSGKWQLSGTIPDLVHEAGFDEYCMWAYTHNLPAGVEHTGGWQGKPGKTTSRYWHPSIVSNGKYIPTKPSDYGPDRFADFAIDFARRHRDGPFLVYCPMALTHAPYYATPDTTKTPEDKFKHLKSNWRANVEYMDKTVGRIVTALDELGLRDNTILFFTGDNGTGGNGKGRPTEMGARVPMVVNGPGLVKAIGKSAALVDLSDILPTLAEFAEAPLPADRPIDGQSFAPILRGETQKVRDWIYSYIGDRRVLRDERWLLENNSPREKGSFYDCGSCRDGTDYREVTDTDEPEVVAARKRFDDLLADKPVPVLPDDGQSAGKQRQDRGGKVKSGGQWSSEWLKQPERWSAGSNSPVVCADPRGLRIAVREGQKRGVAMIPTRYTLPAGVKTARLRVAEISPNTTWIFKLAGNWRGTGRISAAHTTEISKTGVVELALDKRVLALPAEPWLVKLGLTGAPGSFVVIESVEFTQ